MSIHQADPSSALQYLLVHLYHQVHSHPSPWRLIAVEGDHQESIFVLRD